MCISGHEIHLSLMPNALVQLVASLRYVLGGVPVPVVGRVLKRAEPSLICRYISQNPTFGGESGFLLSFANFNTVFFLQPQHNMLIIQALLIKKFPHPCLKRGISQ